MEETKEVRQIPIEDIIPNRFQPRINFDEKALNELASSIKQHGIIQPLVLRTLGDKFEIIAGERRYKAATIAGLKTVPAIVTQMDDDTSAEVALVENVQRKDLTSIEEAKSYKTMLERGNLTQEELAKKMGLSQSTIANKLRLLNLSPEVQDALLNEKISERHARALLALPNKEEQIKWLDRIINERLTVRQLDLAIKDEQNEKNPAVISSSPAAIENDVPIVNINPDIDQIINNAVDINAADNKPSFTSINAMSNIQGQTMDEEKPVQNNVVEHIDDKMPNKFFNFLEDQEVNMNFDEPNVSVQNNENTDINQPVSMDTFSFEPEFKTPDAVEEVNAPGINGLDQPQVPVQPMVDNIGTNVVEENIQQNNSIFIPDNTVGNDKPEDLIYMDNQVPAEPYNENNNFSEPSNVSSVANDEPIFSPIVENETNTVVEPTQYVDNSMVNEVEISEPEFVEPVQPGQFFNVAPQPTETPVTADENIVSNDIQNGIPNDSVEPIPTVTEENVVDPVSYFDTLDPGFLDKIKEQEGLDLKTAINEYRNITSILNSRGFNIQIDEADEPDKYHIVIDIDKI